MVRSASGEGLVPEQVWENPDLAASPYGTDPTTASIGFVDGQPAGSAAPLTWAQAQELRLIINLGTAPLVDQPAIVADRYVDHPAPAAVPVTMTAPAGGTTVGGELHHGDRHDRPERDRQHQRRRHRRGRRLVRR